mgnify:CR=1 FL=1
MLSLLLNFSQVKLLKYTNSKQFVKSKLSENSSLITISSELERDDDDPLSIRSLSISFLGFIFAFLTFLLPSISIFIGRPVSNGNEVISNHDFKKDGP